MPLTDSTTATTTTTTTTTTTDNKTTYVRPLQTMLPQKEYTTQFTKFIDSKPGLTKFYNLNAVEEKAKEGKKMGDKLMGDGCGPEFALSLSLLTLYNIVMLIDDSLSMETSEEGTRKVTLEKTLQEITKIYDQANENGILAVRFINARRGKKNVTNSKVKSLFLGREYKGWTMIGTALEKKVLEHFVYKQPLEKPLLVMTVTDGMIEGEKSGKLKHVIKKCIKTLELDTETADGSVAFHFCRVGNDQGALDMLKHLDDCKEIGKYVDCLPVDDPLEALEDDSLKWGILVKLLIGALDADIDNIELVLDLKEEITPIDLSVVIKPVQEDSEDDD